MLKIQSIVNEAFKWWHEFDDRHEFSRDSSRELNMDHPIISLSFNGFSFQNKFSLSHITSYFMRLKRAHGNIISVFRNWAFERGKKVERIQVKLTVTALDQIFATLSDI